MYERSSCRSWRVKIIDYLVCASRRAGLIFVILSEARAATRPSTVEEPLSSRRILL